MSVSPISRYLRQATRKDGEPLNILTQPTHEAYETGLCKTGHNFYSIQTDSSKKWVKGYRRPPINYHLLKPETDSIVRNLPMSVDFDLVLSQNRFGQYQTLCNIANVLNLPMINLEHTLPVTNWSQEKIYQILQMRGHMNVYISEYSLGKWGDSIERSDTSVIHHCIDSSLFKPSEEKSLEDYCLVVCNDYINRSWCCGYNIFQEIQKNTNINFRIFGDTKGLSKPAESVEHLAKEYGDAPIFLNTSTVSPVPTALLEAMSAGCAIVTTGTCMIPEIIQSGFNGFMSNDPKELAEYIDILRKDKNLRSQMGAAARATVLQKFGEERFIREWNELFYKVANETR